MTLREITTEFNCCPSVASEIILESFGHGMGYVHSPLCQALHGHVQAHSVLLRLGRCAAHSQQVSPTSTVLFPDFLSGVIIFLIFIFSSVSPTHLHPLPSLSPPDALEFLDPLPPSLTFFHLVVSKVVHVAGVNCLSHVPINLQQPLLRGR